MSYCRILSRASFGIEAPLVAVEIHLSNGLPALNIVGLANAEVKESRERVRSAIINSGFEFPARRITINLAPADLPKSGGRFDLAIAMGILIASEQLDSRCAREQEFLAELGLNGELKPVTGVLISAHSAKLNERAIWVATDNAQEAALSGSAKILTARSLKELVDTILMEPTSYYQAETRQASTLEYQCLSRVYGNEHAKFALALTACGGHNLLMIGTPGSGKTMLANCLPSILPELSREQAFAVAALESVSLNGFNEQHWNTIRIRRPHHSCTQVAMTGGGKMPTPGEISLAHHGILFLDELPHFGKAVLESLRQPLEDKQLTISRSGWKVTFPAHFQLIAAMNPCACGYMTSRKTACRCSEPRLKSYLEKLSGPLLDRIDIQVMVNETDHSILEMKATSNIKSTDYRIKVDSLRRKQRQRQGCLNADLSADDIQTVKPLTKNAKKVFISATAQFNLSMRSQQKALRIALTISDWNEQSSITESTLSQALSFRAFDQIHNRLAKGFLK